MVRLRRKGKKISNPCRNLKKLLHLSSKIFVIIWILSELFIPLHRFRKTESNMVAVVQLVRASDCGSECRRFESDQPPQGIRNQLVPDSFFAIYHNCPNCF